MGAFRRPRRLQMHQKRIRTDRTSSCRLLQLQWGSRWYSSDEFGPTAAVTMCLYSCLHLSCTGSDQPGHQNYGTLTWRFSISLFLPSGFSPQLDLRVHPRSSHRLCGYKISSALIFCVLNFSLFSPFIRCSFCPVIDYWSVWMWGLRSALAASGSINKWSWTWRRHLVSSLWEIKAAQRYITD